MLKFILLGIWGSLVSCATTVALLHYESLTSGLSHEAKVPTVQTISTHMLRVPIMVAEKPTGYVLLDIDIDYDSRIVSSFSEKLAGIAVDESFRAVYESAAVDFSKSEKPDLSGLLKTVSDRLNKRLGEGAVKDIRIKEFMFVPARKS